MAPRKSTTKTMSDEGTGNPPDGAGDAGDAGKQGGGNGGPPRRNKNIVMKGSPTANKKAKTSQPNTIQYYKVHDGVVVCHGIKSNGETMFMNGVTNDLNSGDNSRLRADGFVGTAYLRDHTAPNGDGVRRDPAPGRYPIKVTVASFDNEDNPPFTSETLESLARAAAQSLCDVSTPHDDTPAS